MDKDKSTLIGAADYINSVAETVTDMEINNDGDDSIGRQLQQIALELEKIAKQIK